MEKIAKPEIKKKNWRYRLACRQGYCPTTKEIENSDVISLANRLKAGTYKETLANILEWQDRNITFWTERHPLSTIFLYSFLSIFVAGALLVACLVSFNAVTIQTLVWTEAVWIAILMTDFALSFGMIGGVIHSNRKIPVAENFDNIFASSMSINALLKNKLGVCRDYAKLTACILLNIYPNAEIYFATAPSHVATGIMIQNKLYMLDQRLPIATIDKWNDYRKMKKILKFEGHSIKVVDSNVFLSKTHTESMDEEARAKLADKVSKWLDIKNHADNKASSLSTLTIRWRKGAIIYEDDELVNYSLLRLLKARFSSELVDVGQITKIEIVLDGDNLNFLLERRS